MGVVLNNWSASSFSFLDWNVPSGSSLCLYSPRIECRASLALVQFELGRYFHLPH